MLPSASTMHKSIASLHSPVIRRVGGSSEGLRMLCLLGGVMGIMAKLVSKTSLRGVRQTKECGVSEAEFSGLGFWIDCVMAILLG